MKKLFLSCTLCAFLILASCSNENKSPILNETITETNIVEIVEKMENDKNISKSEIDMFNNGITLLNSLKDSISGKTVGSIIEMEVNRLRNNSFVQLNSNANRVAFNNNLLFAVQKFVTADQEDGSKYNVAVYQFINQSGKDVKFLRGSMELYSTDGTLVKKFSIEISDLIPAGKTLTKNYPYPHNDNNDRDVYVRNNMDLLRVTWKPYILEFTDGTRFEIEVNKI